MGASDCLQGIRNVPTKLRIQISRKRNDDEDAKVSKHVCAHMVCNMFIKYSRYGGSGRT